MKNTESFYQLAKAYQSARADIIGDYEKNVERLNRFKDSQGYQKSMTEAAKKRDEALEPLQTRYRTAFKEVFAAMRTRAELTGKKSLAVTDEQLRLLDLIRMKKEPTQEELQEVAETVKENPIALSIVREIATEKHLMLRNHSLTAGGMAAGDLQRVLNSLETRSEDFLLYDTTRASRLGSAYSERHYGEGLPTTKRPHFTDKESCYEMLAGIDYNELQAFSVAVDDE